MAEAMNDVDVQRLKQFDGALRENPALGKFTIKLTSTWLRGTKTLVEVGSMHALGNNLFPRTRRFVIMMDDPPALGGVDSGPAPAETFLAGLAGCITQGIASNAALHGVPIEGLNIDMEADLDLRGMLAHDKTVRPGFTDIRYTVTIQSPAPEEQVRRCKETIDRQSPLVDTVASPVNVTSKFVHKPE